MYLPIQYATTDPSFLSFLFVSSFLRLSSTLRYHCFGTVLGSLACVSSGAGIVFPSPTFDPARTLHSVETEACTALYGVRLTVCFSTIQCSNLRLFFRLLTSSR